MKEKQKIKKFSEVRKKEHISFPNAEYIGDKEDLVDKKIVIKRFVEKDGDFEKYVTVLAGLDGKEITFSIGGNVAKLIRENKDELPYETTFTKGETKKGVYFDLK